MGSFRKNLLWILLIIVLLIGASPFIKKMLWLSESDETLKIAVSSLPETYDMITRSEYFTNLVLGNIFDKLFEYENNVYTPVIGSNWYNLSDSVTVIQIKNPVLFHNGEILTANDVKESIKRMLNHPKSYFYNLITVDSIDVKSSETLYIYHAPHIDVQFFLMNVPIYSAKQLAQFDDSFIKYNPIGTGAYYLFSYGNEKVILKKNRFISKNQTYRLFDQLEFDYIPSRDDQVNQLLKGQVDFIINPPMERYTVLRNSEHINMKQIKSGITMYMMFDLVRPKTPDIPLSVNPLRDVRVRKAIVHAVDIDQFIEEYLHGNATSLSLPWTSSLLGTDKSLPFRKYDPELSRQLLKQAGYPNGFSMVLHCIENKYYGDKELGQYVKKALEEIGIKTELKLYRSEEFYNTINTRQVSCFITGYSIHGLDTMSALRSLFYSSEGYTGTMNRFNYYNPEINQIVDQVKDMAENDKRKDELLLRASQLVYDNVLILPFYNPQDIYAYSKKIEWNPYSNELKIKDFRKK